MQLAATLPTTGGPDEYYPLYLPITEEQGEYILASLSDFADEEAESVCNRLRKLLYVSSLSIVK